MAVWADFKKFAFKGNVIDLAVGVIIGAAFGKIVSALVNDIMMPLVAAITPGSGNWRDAWKHVLKHAPDPKNDAVIRYGDFFGAVLDFFIVAFTLFLVVSRILQAAEKKLGIVGDRPASTKECPFCCELVPMKATRCKSCTSKLDVLSHDPAKEAAKNVTSVP